MVRRRKRHDVKMPAAVSSSRLWHCSVCDGSFGTKKDWLSHLLLSEHQDKARVKFVRWDSDVRDCVVVAYSSFPVANEDVLIYFSKGCDTVVTDFVWFLNRPKMGIIQFESRWKAQEVFSNANGPQLQIQNQLVQLKRGADLLDLEWMEMMPDGLDDETAVSHELLPVEAPSVDTTAKAPKVKKSTKKVEAVRPKYAVMVVEAIRELNAKRGSSLKAIKKYIASVHNVDVEENEVFVRKALKKAVKNGSLIIQSKGSRGADLFMLAVANKIMKNESAGEDKEKTELALANLSEPAVSSNGLVAQFNEIRREVEIPDDQYNIALEIMEKIEQILKPRFPLCKAYMLRHWYLKLRTNGSNNLIIFVNDHDTFSGSQPQLNSEVERLSNDKIREILLADSQDILPCKHIGTDTNSKMEGFTHKQTGMKFVVATGAAWMSETQTCRLLRYLCTFDSRAIPFITLIMFWARINKIKFANKISWRTRHSAVEPAALEWLVMFFLSNIGVVPSPREVLMRPHQHVTFCNQDIGFSTDEEFSRNWTSSTYSSYPCESEEFVLEILKLAYNFFLFIYNLKTRPCVLNTRDGELIPSKGLMLKKGKSKLTDPDVEYLKRLSCSSSKSWILQGNLVLLHPLSFGNSLSFSQYNFMHKTSWYMKRSAEKIAKVLESNVSTWKVGMKSLLAVEEELKNSGMKERSIALDSSLPAMNGRN